MSGSSRASISRARSWARSSSAGLTDRFGRKKLFFITLGLYTVATAATAFSFDLVSFCLFRFLTGAGIGGEYSAINSTIQEFTPGAAARAHRYRDQRLVLDRRGAGRGRVDSVLLNPARFAPDIGWRAAFFIGAVLGLLHPRPADFHPRKPALARHPRPGK